MPDKVNVNNNSSKSNIASLNASHTPIQPKSELQLNERDQKLATLQKMADNSPYNQRFAHFTSIANNSIQKQPVSQLSKDSHSLPDNVKQGVESLSGISMDDVKVHYNSDKPAQLNAYAYAQGTDIHIASGQEKHLPHEAWHVVQQKQGRVQPTTMMKAKVFINDDKGLEKEADVMGARALQMKPFSLSDYKTEKSVQRKEIIQREIDTSPSPSLPELAPDETPEWKKVDEATTDKRNQAMKDEFEAERLEKINEAPKESSPNQRLVSVSSEIITLSESIKKIKEKKAKEEAAEKANKDEEARMAIAEAALERAKKAKTVALEAAKILSEIAKKTAVKNESRQKAEEVLKKAAEKAKNTVAEKTAEAAREAAAREAAAEAAREAAAREAAAEAAREAAAEATKINAVNDAEKEKEKAKNTLNEWFGSESKIANFVDLGAVPGKAMDQIAKVIPDGSAKTLLEENVTKGAFVGNLGEACELLSSAGKFFNSEKKPADLALVGATVVKFGVGVVDTINTSAKGGLIGDYLSSTISLLPGIKSGLGLFKNSIELYQINKKRENINELLEKTGHLTSDDIEVIEKYKTAIIWSLKEIGVDALFNLAETIATLCPAVQVGISLFHGAVNLFKFGCKQYISYLENKELKRIGRIEDADVETLKSIKIEEKSGRLGFKDALDSLFRLEHLRKDFVNNQAEINIENENLRIAIKYVNNNSLGKEPITEANLATFLNLERLTIKNIKKEVDEEKGFIESFFGLFKTPKKETIIADLKANNTIIYNNIDQEDISKLNVEAKDYFFNKTKDAIKAACNREHVSASGRLEMLIKVLKTKYDDTVIRSYMLDKYKDQNVYENTESEKVKFEKSVNKFKNEMEL